MHQINYMTSNIGTANMYVIQTDMGGGSDFQMGNKKVVGGRAPSAGPVMGSGSVMEGYLRQENDQMRDQVKDLETNLNINKEIIKNLLESQNVNGSSV